MLERRQRAVEVITFHAPLGQMGDSVEGAATQVLTRSLDPLPGVAREQLAAVLGDRPFECLGGRHRIAHARRGSHQRFFEAPDVDAETFDLQPVGVADPVDDLHVLDATHGTQPAPKVAEGGPEPLRPATGIGLRPQGFDGGVERRALGM